MAAKQCGAYCSKLNKCVIIYQLVILVGCIVICIISKKFTTGGDSESESGTGCKVGTVWEEVEVQDPLHTDEQCRVRGGVCKQIYHGCDNGKFIINLCPPGLNEWQCCVQPAHVLRIVKEALPSHTPWRMCYDCRYTVSNKLASGNENCLKFSNASTLVDLLPQTNCSGNCTKEWLRLDKNNYSIVRRCADTCRGFSIYDDHTLHCCRGNLCNTGPKIVILSVKAFLSCLAISFLCVLHPCYF